MISDAPIAEPATAIAWEKRVPLLTNLFMLKDLALVFWITSLAVLALWLLVAGGEDLVAVIEIWAFCMALFAVLLIVSSLIVLLNRMDLAFEVGPKGVRMSVGKRERRLNALTTAAGLLKGSPQAVGAGLLARSQEDLFVPWRDVRKATVYGKRKVIALNVGMLTPLRVYCTDDNFAAVERVIREKAKGAVFKDR